jgi:hypothetical protein
MDSALATFSNKFQDKPGKSSLEHIQEEILEECGYQVPADRIESVKRYVTGISISGAAQHLFYARIVSLFRYLFYNIQQFAFNATLKL